MGNEPSADVIWERLREESRKGAESEPIPAGYLHSTIRIEARMIRDTANKLIENFYGVLPYETAVHLANAQKEFLKAVESIIDEQIKWTDIHIERAHGKKESL